MKALALHRKLAHIGKDYYGLFVKAVHIGNSRNRKCVSVLHNDIMRSFYALGGTYRSFTTINLAPVFFMPQKPYKHWI